MNSSVQKLTYAAVLSAISIVLITIANYISTPDSLLYFAASVPIAIYAMKYNLVDSLIMGICVILISMLTTNILSAFLISLPVVLIGVILGFFRASNLNMKLGLLLSMILSIGFDFIITYAYASVYGINLLEEIKHMHSVLFDFINITNINIDMISQVSLVLTLLLFGITKIIFINLLIKFISKRLNVKKEE